MLALKGLFMEKWMCWGSMGVAGLLLVLFLLDMIFGVLHEGDRVPTCGTTKVAELRLRHDRHYLADSWNSPYSYVISVSSRRASARSRSCIRASPNMKALE